MKSSKFIRIPPMINIKENNTIAGLEIKERPVAACDAKRESKRKRLHFFDMQPWIPPIILKTPFLYYVKPFDFLRQFAKRPNKVIRMNYLHTGGNFLSALLYERWMRDGWEYLEISSLGRRSEISFLISFNSWRMCFITSPEGRTEDVFCCIF